jgi:anti-anti-sigma factor
MMDVSYVLTDEALVVAPVGRIDEASWEEFGSKLTSGLEQASAQSRGTLVIDLSGVDYMSSRGLRVLTVARQRGSAAGVAIRLAAPNDVMREILAISRYDRLFDVDDEAPHEGSAS